MCKLPLSHVFPLIVEIQSLTKVYESKIVRGAGRCRPEVETGEIFGLLGPNARLDNHHQHSDTRSLPTAGTALAGIDV